MTTEERTIWLAALLHDIGKFRQRALAGASRGTHEEHGARFIEEDFAGFFAPCGDDLAHGVANHHRPSRDREVERVVALADRLSACERETEERPQETPGAAALVSVLSRPPLAPEGAPERRFRLTALSWQEEGSFFPSVEAQVDADDYRCLWEAFSTEFKQLGGSRGYAPADFTTILALLRKYTSRMPAATPWEGEAVRTVPDVSLYDHLKTTAAIAACVRRELGPDDVDQLLRALARGGDDEGALSRELCALVKGDVSGTQDFLYLLSSRGAARGLRGRSFYLQLLTETVAHWLLRALDLPVTNLLFAGGGHFYLLLPYRQTCEMLDELRVRLAQKLWAAHRGDLALSVETVPVCGSDFVGGGTSEASFAHKWGEVSGKLAERKQRRWAELGPETIVAEVFSAQEQGGVENVCDICRNEGNLIKQDDVRKCTRCEGFEKLGNDLRAPRLMVVTEVPEVGFPVGGDWRDVLRSFGAEVRLCSSLEELALPSQARSATVYRLDATEFLAELPRSWGNVPASLDFRYLANATPRKGDHEVAGFDDLCHAAEGVKWLGVLRMDVDDLGPLFRKLGAEGSLSRVCAASESLRLFFEGWVPGLCRRYNPYPQGKDAVYLIYAGGDDLFVVGAWSVLPSLARSIRDDFRRFVGGDHVTLSGGIAIEHQKYPLYQLANDAKHALDDRAKEHRRPSGGRPKDALCLLQTPMGWEQFGAVADWHDRLVKALAPLVGAPPLPRGFLSRLSEVYHLYAENAAIQRRRRREGRITDEQMEEEIAYAKWMWRLVYQLGRFAQRHKDHETTVEELQRALVSDRSGLMPLLQVLARWTALVTREGDDS
jgi:CRISPR-associated protein Csm1